MNQMVVLFMMLVAYTSFLLNWNDMQQQYSLWNDVENSSLHYVTRQSTVMNGEPQNEYALTMIPSLDELIQEKIISPPIHSDSVESLGDASSNDDVRDDQEITRESPVPMIRAVQEGAFNFNFTRPPLDTIIDDENNIVGDPDWLLDFAIMGYGKCGTSTMMFWLKEHPEIQAFGSEKGHFMSRKPGLMVRQLYEILEPGPYQRGYKAPQDVTQKHILDYYRMYWPHTKIILGIRHPIRWFESLYNFRVQNLRRELKMPHPNDLIGPCRAGKFLTCTNKGDFANSMLKLGKQNYPYARPATDLETTIVARYSAMNRTFDTTTAEYMPNPVFLFELDQLSDSNTTRSELFRNDFTRFMDLKERLPTLPHYKPGRKRPEHEQINRDSMKIQICDDEYKPVREELMVLSKSNSLWIREVFLKSHTVYVSSRDHFESILEGWMKDPCDDDVVAMDESNTDQR
jgi:hypothetical protein